MAGSDDHQNWTYHGRTVAGWTGELPAWYWDRVRQRDQLVTYAGMVLLVLGTIGNLLTFLVMSRRCFRKTTTSLYLRVLAVVDTLCLYNGLLRHWIIHTYQIDVRNLSQASCKIHFYVLYASTHFEAWTLVSVALERVVAIFAPAHAKTLFSRRRAAIGLAALGATLALLNTNILVNYELQDTAGPGVGGGLMCAERPSPAVALWYELHVTPWVDLFVASVLPFVILLACNVAIVANVAYVNKHSVIPESQRVKVHKLTAMLVTCFFFFFVTTLPICIFLLGMVGWYKTAKKSGNAEMLADLDLAWVLVNLVWYLNFSFNFLLYVMMGKPFRREFLAMMRQALTNVTGRQFGNSVEPATQCNTLNTVNTLSAGLHLGQVAPVRDST